MRQTSVMSIRALRNKRQKAWKAATVGFLLGSIGVAILYYGWSNILGYSLMIIGWLVIIAAIVLDNIISYQIKKLS